MTTGVKVDLKQLRRQADIGVVRASVFLGLTINATKTEPQLSHVLDDNVQIRFVPNDVPQTTSTHFIEEFTYWTIGNALREMVETFSAFLVQCRLVSHMFATGQTVEHELSSLKATIENKNVSQLYNDLGEIVGLDSLYAEMFESFRQARNCLAHRRGVVAKRDLNTDDNHFKLLWCFMAPHVRDLKNGHETLLDRDSVSEGIQVGESGGEVIVRMTWKEEKFPLGSQIKLSRHTLAEICFGVHLAACHVVGKLHEFALANGIPDADFENAEDAALEFPENPEVPENLDRED